MKSRITGILFAVASFFAFSVWAERTTEEDAMLVAKAWLMENSATYGDLGEPVSAAAHSASDGSVQWYAVTLERGTIFVSPDTEIEPIIAVVPKSTGEIPAGHPLRAMLELDMGNRVATAKTATSGRLKLAAAPSKTAQKWAKLKGLASDASSTSRIKLAGIAEPKTIVRWLDGWNSPNTENGVQTLRFWDQTDSIRYFSNNEVFNVYTPDNDPCGCVATAGSVVMHYFRVPTRAVVNRKCKVDDVDTYLQSRGGLNNWALIDEMQLTYGQRQTLSPDQLELLASVAYDCGVGCEMMYAKDGSGSYSSHLNRSFRDVFNVRNAQTVTHTGRDYVYTNDEIQEVGNYDKLIYNQIRAGAPVVMGIKGHEVVACGYGYDKDETDYTYVFMGWGGSYDAWYALPEIDTKATVGGSGYVSTLVSELITNIAPADDRYIPLVGQVVDPYGSPIENYEGLTLEDETPIAVDENGYFGVRTSPKHASIFDGSGEETLFDVGALAESTSWHGVAADDLANALPGAKTIVVDTSKPGYLRTFKNLEKAAQAAWRAGKLLYIFGGLNREKVDARKEELKMSDPEFKDRFVFCELPCSEPTALITEEFQEGAFDPRVFSATGSWSEENGLWGDPLTWGDEDRSIRVVALSGTKTIGTTIAGNSYKYECSVTFGDGVTKAFESGNSELLVVSIDNADLGTLNYDTLIFTPMVGVGGFVTMSATCASFGPGDAVRTELKIELRNTPVRVPVADADNDYHMSDLSDDIAKAYARLIAERAGGSPLSAPLEGNPGIVVTAKVKNPKLEFYKEYVFKCVGYEVYKDGMLAAEGEGSQIDVLLDTADIDVRWVWQTVGCYLAASVTPNQSTLLSIKADPEGFDYTHYYEIGSVVKITATSHSAGGIVFWKGAEGSVMSADGRELTITVDSPKEVIAYVLAPSEKMSLQVPYRSAIDALRDATTFDTPTGYALYPYAYVKNRETVYTLQLINGTVVDPAPIRIKKLALLDDWVTLTFEDVVRNCIYTIWGAPTVKDLIQNPEIVSTFVSEDNGECTITLPCGANGFWKITGERGVSPYAD